MGQYKYHVILADGSEYLTETLAEARALEARHGHSKHLPMRQRVEQEADRAVSNPAPTPTPAHVEENPRQSPQKIARVEGRDPRNPPVGTVLSKGGLTVVFDHIDGADVYHVVAPTRQNMRGTYTALSGLVKKYLGVEAYNGYQFFGLQGGYTGKHLVGTLGEQGLSVARESQDTPVSEYAVDWRGEALVAPPPKPAREPPSPDRTPLYGHKSEETAHVVDHYPYGYRLRTQIRYWAEYAPNRGFRYASQTLNPRVHRWNAPNKSTYAEIAGQLYLDREQHVHFARLTEYSNANEVREFLRDFPHTDKTVIRVFLPAKIRFLRRRIALLEQGQTGYTMNGVPVPPRIGELADEKAELAKWQEANEYL